MRPLTDPVITRMLVRAAVKAYAELNAIRARDGVPYTYYGCRSDANEEYFSSVVDELSAAVEAATGKPAHCHPELYLAEDQHEIDTKALDDAT